MFQYKDSYEEYRGYQLIQSLYGIQIWFEDMRIDQPEDDIRSIEEAYDFIDQLERIYA